MSTQILIYLLEKIVKFKYKIQRFFNNKKKTHGYEMIIASH